MKLYLCILLSFFFAVQLFSQQEETESQKKMAAQMAKMMDAQWEATPEAGTANLNILMLKDGKPFAGKVSMFGEFQFRLTGIQQVNVSFNPNANGRYVVENIRPGTYAIEIEGTGDYEAFYFESPSAEFSADETLMIEVELGEEQSGEDGE